MVRDENCLSKDRRLRDVPVAVPDLDRHYNAPRIWRQRASSLLRKCPVLTGPRPATDPDIRTLVPTPCSWRSISTLAGDWWQQSLVASSQPCNLRSPLQLSELQPSSENARRQAARTCVAATGSSITSTRLATTSA